ncbi:MAG: hypothetical protein FJ087_12360, partial [Deltaproteobacteria bacterium]|nr:hypothetical protein [Deltaproteobacteria bacterium]
MERPVETVFTRRFDRLVRRGAALLAGAFALSVSFTLWAIWPSNEAVGYRPAQPVAFPHDVMAGQVKIDALVKS